jgi:hypothetical protein
MPKRSDNFPLVLAGFVFGFAYLFKTMFEGLLYTWVLKQLERHLGLLEAEVLAKLSDIGVAFFVPARLSGSCTGTWLTASGTNSKIYRN